MKKAISFIVILIAALVVFGFALKNMPSEVKVSKVIDAQVYDATSMIGKTSITIDGVIQRQHFSTDLNQTFVGTFAIDVISKTRLPNVRAEIEWLSDESQTIVYYFNGDYTSFEILSLNIDRDMYDLKIILNDGTIIET